MKTRRIEKLSMNGITAVTSTIINNSNNNNNLVYLWTKLKFPMGFNLLKYKGLRLSNSLSTGRPPLP